MTDTNYYHMFANGADSRDFIISESDFYCAFNLVGVCAANTDAAVVAFSIEDSHPHILLYGTKDECVKFKIMYERTIMHRIAKIRGTTEGVSLKCELYAVNGEEYLKTVAIYCIIQPTKDGKAIMPFDYLWGTGSMYFRTAYHIPIWWTGPGKSFSNPVPVSTLSARERKRLVCSKRDIPDNWQVCNGFILPSNYVDVERFESIFITPNCYRVFLGNSKKKEDVVTTRMAKVRGVNLSDLEARRIASDECYSLFRKHSARWLGANDRIVLAIALKRHHQMSPRQIATLVRLPEEEVRKYLK
ncbi:MAG: hypothetical protein MJY66_07395 [Bacteroidaceae bacterium]|nr:hypothetical protein [Bacteroidaceae bacterium]